MSNPSKRKGTAHENAVVTALKTRWPSAERRVQRGKNDAGDVAGVPFTVECKNEARVNLAGWFQEAVNESAHNDYLPPLVIAKRKGVADPFRQWVIMDIATLLRLQP